MSSEYDAMCDIDSKPQKWRSADVKTTENVEFTSLLLSDRILQGLKNCGFEKPSPVQLQAIPLGRCGLDLVVQAKSGTGKTCVLAVIALDNLITDSPNTQVLILAPTREIASQICGVVNDLGCAFPNLTCETFIGGLPLSTDKAKLPNCQIVVGTPGRVKQLIDMEHLQTDSIRLFVVDEADRLFDKQFKEDINWIFSSLPSRKQILALSATYPEELSNFLTLYMENPVFVRISSKDPALLGITQYFCSTPYHPLLQVLDSAKFDILLDILNNITFSQCMIFCQRQSKAQDLADNLVLKGFPTLGICGALDQSRRLEIIHELKSFQCRVLVSTDLTARGIDAENVNLVINFDVPYESEVYLHRIGRAGRYGTRGMSISIAASGDEIKRLISFQTKFLFKIYQLPDPIPADLWDVTVAVQSALAEELGNEGQGVSAEPCGLISANGVSGVIVHEVSDQQKRTAQPPVNDSTLFQNQSDHIRTSEIGNDTDTLGNHKIPVLNSHHEKFSRRSSDLKVSEGTFNEEGQFINIKNESGKLHEVANHDCNIVGGQTEPEIRSELPYTSEVAQNEEVELMVSTNGATENKAAVIENNGETLCFVDEINKSSSFCSLVGNFNETNNYCLMSDATSLKFDLPNASDSDACGTEDLNSSEKIIFEEQCAHEQVKTDNCTNVDLEVECISDSKKVVASEETVHSTIMLNTLFQNWEEQKHLVESLDFGGKEVSAISLPLLNSGEMKYFRSDISYDELVNSLQNCTEGATSNLSNNEETRISHTSISKTQLQVVEKLILHNKYEFLSRAQKSFCEMGADLSSCKNDEASTEPLSYDSMNNGSSDVQVSGLYNDNQCIVEAKSISQSSVRTSCETNVNVASPKNEVSNKISILNDDQLQSRDQNSSEVKPFPRRSIDIIADTVCSGMAATKPCTETKGSAKERLIPLGHMKEDSNTCRYNKFSHAGHKLTEENYESVNCGMAHYKIVPLPSNLCNPPRNSVVNAKNGNAGHASNQKGKTKNQSMKKEVKNERHRTSQKTQKLKQHENHLNSSQVSPFEQSSYKHRQTENSALLSSAYQETETGCISWENVASKYVSVPHVVEYNTDSVKKKRVKSLRSKHKHDLPDQCAAKINSHTVHQNPTSFIKNVWNGNMNRAGFSEMCDSPTYDQNRVNSNVTCTSSPSKASQKHGVHSHCVNVCPVNVFTPQYDCCCQLAYPCENGNYFWSSAPYSSTYPQCYFFKKYLELWYYIQNLTHGHHHY